MTARAVTNLLLLAGCVGLGVFVWQVPESPNSPARPSVTGPVKVGEGPRTSVLPAPPPAASYLPAHQLPLFSPTRRPGRTVSTRSVATTPAPRLLGILVAGDRRLAILKLPGRGRSVLAAPGQAVGSWRVRSIGPSRVRLVQGKQVRDLVLPGTKPAAPEKKRKQGSAKDGPKGGKPAATDL